MRSSTEGIGIVVVEAAKEIAVIEEVEVKSDTSLHPAALNWRLTLMKNCKCKVFLFNVDQSLADSVLDILIFCIIEIFTNLLLGILFIYRSII